MNEKKILKKSELLEQIRDDFMAMESGQNDLDPGFFTPFNETQRRMGCG